MPWVAIGLGLAAVVLVAGAPGRGQGRPLDPDSPSPTGTKALVEVLRQLGNSVQVSSSPPEGPTSAMLILVDDLDSGERSSVADWVRAGGVLVVADPSSRITGVEPVGPTSIGPVSAEIERRCELGALREVRLVSAPDDAVLKVPDGATGCFPRNHGSWLVVQPLGSGTVIRLGGRSALLNRELGKADNGLLVASLLAPRTPATVIVRRLPEPGGGNKSLTDLIGPRVKLALLQLGIAFVVFSLWRARRLGRPVREPQPVQIPGSELVVAVGNLLQRAKARHQAASVLADDLRRILAGRLGLPASAPAEQVAEVAAARTGIRVERFLTVLRGITPRDEAELVALAHAIDAVRREVTSVR